MISREKSVISNNTFSEYNRVGIKSHLSIRLCVLRQIIGAWCAVAEAEDAQRRKVEDYAELLPEMEKLKGPERLP